MPSLIARERLLVKKLCDPDDYLNYIEMAASLVAIFVIAVTSKRSAGVDQLKLRWSELAKLKNEGKVRYIGVSNFNVDQMKRAQAIAPITSLQPPYAIVRRQIEDHILPFCAAQNIGVIVYSPMYAGLLTGSMTKERVANFLAEDWRKSLPGFQEPHLSRNLRLVEMLRSIGRRHGRTPGEVAIAWTLHHPAVTGAIVGFRNSQQVSGIAGAATFRLLPSEMEESASRLAAEPAEQRRNS